MLAGFFGCTDSAHVRLPDDFQPFFIVSRQVRRAHPAIGNRRQLMIHIKQRQARAQPGRHTLGLQQLLEHMMMAAPCKHQRLATGAQADMQRFAVQSRTGQALATERHSAQAANAGQIQWCAQIPDDIQSRIGRMLRRHGHQQVAVTPDLSARPAHTCLLRTWRGLHLRQHFFQLRGSRCQKSLSPQPVTQQVALSRRRQRQ
ncbi:MAG: hypothetical protein H6R46_506 [Proteobacteria bacterium]|nr:hypothetical protein [Pseudomonadota bacterium]